MMEKLLKDLTFLTMTLQELSLKDPFDSGLKSTRQSEIVPKNSILDRLAYPVTPIRFQ